MKPISFNVTGEGIPSLLRRALAAALFALLVAPGSAWAMPGLYVTAQTDDEVGAYKVGAGGSVSPGAYTSATGHLPEAVAVSPDGKSAYVVNYSAGTISQYSGESWQYTGLLDPDNPATVATGGFPAAVAVSPDGRSVYVANAGDGTISQYDAGSGGLLTPKTPATVSAGSSPLAVAVSPDGSSAYVANSGDGTVSQYDVGSGGLLTPKTPATMSAGTGPDAIAAAPDGTSVYVVNRGGTVSQYDVGTGGQLSPKTPPTVPTGAFPTAIALAPNGASLYVTAEGNGALGSPGTVSQYDVGGGGLLSPKTQATVATGSQPFGVAVSPSGRSLYVTNNHDNTLSQYDVGTGGVLSAKIPATVSTAYGPFGIVAAPDQGPTAAFGVGAAAAGSPTAFNASASSDSDGTIARYEWSFGDGTTGADAGPTPTHTYAAAGTYTVTLTVTDDAGCSTALVFTGQTASCAGTAYASTTQTVTVPPAGSSPPQTPSVPHASFSYSPASALCPGQTVTFDASASTPGAAPITRYAWKFENGLAIPSDYAYSDGRQLRPIFDPVEDDTTIPTVRRTYDYSVVGDVIANPQTLSGPGIFDPQLEAILGTIVTLEIHNAAGQTNSVTQTLSFRYAELAFDHPSGLDLCGHTNIQVTALPAFSGAATPPTLIGQSTIQIGFGCTRAAICGGTLTLSTVPPAPGLAHPPSPCTQASHCAETDAAARRSTVLGKARLAVPRGQHAVIAVKLNKRGRTLARRGRLRKLRVSVTTVQLGGTKPKTVSRVLAVKRSKPRR